MTLSLVLAALVLGAPVRDPMAPYRDRPVVAVEIDAPAEERVEELARLIEIQPGYLLSTGDVQTALKRLYALGRYSEVAVHAERLSGAVVLRFSLKRIRRLRRLEVEGARTADPDALLAALRIAPGAEIDRRTGDWVREQTHAQLARRGFPQAHVEVKERGSRDGDEITYRIEIDEGEPRRAAELRFAGRPRLAAAVLASLVRTRVGAVLDLDELARDRERLERAYLARGFLGVRVAPPRVSGDPSAAVVTFHVEAGDRIAFYFRGNAALTDATLRRLWPSPTGPMRPGDLDGFTQRIVEAYRREGYAHARVRLRGFRDAEEGVVRFVVAIVEGAAVEVAAIEFPGAEAFSPALLVGQVQGLLAQELTERGTLQRLSLAERALANGARAPSGVRVVPVVKRWVPDVYERAFEAITAAYRDAGYLAATVGPARLEGEDRAARVVVPVAEGPRTYIRSVVFRENQVTSAVELLAVLEAAAVAKAERKETTAPLAVPGTVFSAVGVEESRITLVRRYRDEGYLYARVFSDVTFSSDRSGAEVVFRIEEGPQVRIQNVLIRGNRYTRQDVIEDRMSLQPGELYRLDAALQDQRRIAALGVFSSVRVRLVDEEEPAERKDVVAEVVERDRQAIEFVGGVSTADGPRLRVDYSHLNVAGTAASVSFSLKLNWKLFFGLYGEYADLLAQRYRSFDFREWTEVEARAGIRVPRFETLPLQPAVRFDLVGERDNAIPYSLDALRAIFGFDVLAAERASLIVEPQFALANLRCYPSTVGDSDADCSGTLLDSTRDRRRIAEGLRAEFKIGPSVNIDLRDDALNPKRGMSFTARGVYGVGSGLTPEALKRAESRGTITSADWEPFHYAKLEAGLSAYLPVGASVLAVSVRAGSVIEGAVPIDESFYLGGSSTLRGFQEGALLPADICVRSRTDDPGGKHCVDTFLVTSRNGVLQLPLSSGGDHYVLFKSEARVPLSDELLLAFFVDAGNLWREKVTLDRLTLEVNPGIGLRYTSPAGPIGIDLGVNPAPEQLKGESYVSLHFAVGVF